MIAVVAGVAWAGPPAPVTPSADELTALGKGEVVVRPPDDRGEMIGIVDILGSTRQAIMSAVLDFDLRVRTVSSIQSITVYAPESDPGGLGATFVLSLLGSTVTYHLRYTIDRTAGWCTFTLDPARKSDIAGTWGSYAVSDIAGGHRLTYRSRTDSGQPVPEFVKSWVATRSMRDQLTAMRASALGR